MKRKIVCFDYIFASLFLMLIVNYFYGHHSLLMFKQFQVLDRGNSLYQNDVLVKVQCMIFCLVTQENLGKKAACSKKGLKSNLQI